jgi:serine/threonine protein kinase/tetratricopeptide (TPR) repeat protein/TolB-like protein
MVECPACHTENPPGSTTCQRCRTPFAIEAATILMNTRDLAETVVADPGGGTGWSMPAQAAGGAPDASGPLKPGMVLGERYEILKRLGEGGMGAVYKARDRELDRLVALKVIRPELANHPDVLHRFKQELILARQVTHKNVIRIFDLVTTDGRKFITMDFVDGRDLKTVIVERGKLPPAEAVPLMQQICRGLEAAHTEGVIHRDLKPQNIMVDGAGRVWLMDFGLARSMEVAGITRTGALMGTPDYMSPEQARAEKVDARSDLFSLGVIFYEMLSGRLPFEAETMMAALIKRVQEKAAPLTAIDAAIPPRLSDLVSKCLEPNVAERYQTVGEILEDLAAEAPARAGSSMVGSSVAVPAVSLAALGPGSQFGPRYRIESLIGEGGMGKVFKAHDQDLDRTVALKLVRTELANDPNSMQRFKQELLLASRISHRNILRIHDLGDVGGVKFISMAFVEGRDLHDVIAQSGRLPIERTLNIAKQLAGALEAAHAEGVAHRDLKPRNVLIDLDDHVYVSDFGLAKSLEGEASTMTRVGEVLGTPRYMSPEQAESKSADHRSDIYSLGVILYEMVTGDAPFAGESSMQVMYQHVKQKPKDPRLVNPDLPDYLGKIVLKCLEKDPALRYQSAREVLQDLEAGTPPTRIVRLRIAETGYPKWLIAGMGAVVLLGAAVLIRPVRETVFGRSSVTTKAPVSVANDTFLALLPLRVIGSQAELKYEAEGVVDALSAKLFSMKNVHLAPPAEVEKVSATDPMDKIARQLGVKLVLQGTVQGAGDKIDVVLTLNDAKGSRLWTKEFPGVRQDLLTVEDQMYSELLGALALKPTNEELARTSSRPTENVAAYELYLKGRNVMRGNRDPKHLQSALDLFDQATKKDSGFALAFAGTADASLDMYNQTKDTAWSQKALGAAQHAQTLNDELPEVHFALGNIYKATGKTTEAVVELKRALSLAPNSDEGFRRLANAYMAAGQKDEALKTYQQAIDVNPYYWLNFNRLGTAYFQLGENQKALDAFRKAVELRPDSGAAHENIGVAYYQMGKFAESIPAFEQALKIAPSESLYSNLGTANYYLGRLPEAVKMWEKAAELNPNDQIGQGNLADGYRWSGQLDKAKATYNRAIALAYKDIQVNPRDASTLGYLGVYYAKIGDSKSALKFIRQARGIDPNDTDLIYKEGMIDAIAGQHADALKNLSEAFQKGFPREQAKAEPELKSLATDPDYVKLLAETGKKTN